MNVLKWGPTNKHGDELLLGFPKRAKFSPLFFLVMVNDLRCETPFYNSLIWLCAYRNHQERVTWSPSNLQREIHSVNNWSMENNLKLKTKEFNISTLAISDETLEVFLLNPLACTCLPIWSGQNTTYVQKRVSAYLHFKCWNGMARFKRIFGMYIVVSYGLFL